MKLSNIKSHKYLKIFLSLVLANNIIINNSYLIEVKAEDAPTPGSTETIPPAATTGKDLFKELFSKKLEATDYFLCSSKITLIKNDTANDKKTETLVQQVSRRGKNGTSIYLDLQTAIEKEKAIALDKCNKEKSQVTCVKNALIKNQSEHQLLDFKSRKAFLDAAESECKSIKFECEEAKSSDITCELYQSPEIVVAPSPEAPKAPETKK